MGNAAASIETPVFKVGDHVSGLPMGVADRSPDETAHSARCGDLRFTLEPF